MKRARLKKRYRYRPRPQWETTGTATVFNVAALQRGIALLKRPRIIEADYAKLEAAWLSRVAEVTTAAEQHDEALVDRLVKEYGTVTGRLK